MLKLQSVTFASLSHLYLKTWNCSFLQNYLPCVGLWSGVVPNSDPRQITDSLILLGLGLGVGEEVAISTRGGNNLAGDENGHNTGTAPAWMNLMFWGECVVVSHCTGVDIYCTSQSQILAYVLEYMNFHRILTSEQLTSLPRLFWPTEEKSITINRATNGDLI